MRNFLLVLIALLMTFAAGCAGRRTATSVDRAPYKAVVTFLWEESPTPSKAEDETGDELASSTIHCAPDGSAEYAPYTRTWIEDQILGGLEDASILSDFEPVEPEFVNEVAREADADLVLLFRIGRLADWDDGSIRIHRGLITLDIVLWLFTAVGGCWVPDREYSTRSVVEVAWGRPDLRAEDGEATPVGSGFKDEQLTSGKYLLSLWDRARFWRHPSPYFLTFLMPSGFVPLNDDEEVCRSLIDHALEDFQNQLPQKLSRASLGSGGAPFQFRLEEPANGSSVSTSPVRLRYRYAVERGFEDRHRAGFSLLRVELRGENDRGYRLLREYRDEAIQSINDRITRGEALEDLVDGLAPGRNYVRFLAETERAGPPITNTILLLNEDANAARRGGRQ